jgi:hypothetical protein
MFGALLTNFDKAVRIPIISTAHSTMDIGQCERAMPSSFAGRVSARLLGGSMRAMTAAFHSGEHAIS